MFLISVSTFIVIVVVVVIVVIVVIVIVYVTGRLSVGKISYCTQEVIGKGSQGTVVFR